MLFYYAECRILLTIMLNVIMLSVVMLNVIILSVVARKTTLSKKFGTLGLQGFRRAAACTRRLRRQG